MKETSVRFDPDPSEFKLAKSCGLTALHFASFVTSDYPNLSMLLVAGFLGWIVFDLGTTA